VLGGVQFLQCLLQERCVGGYFGVLYTVAGVGEAGVGLFYSMLDGGELAGFYVGELFLSGVSGASGVSGVSAFGEALTPRPMR